MSFASRSEDGEDKIVMIGELEKIVEAMHDGV